MQNVLTSSRVQKLKEVFDQFDVDKSGQLDQDEVKELLQALGFAPSEEDVQKVIARADNDGNNTIGFDEFAAGCFDESDSNVYSGIPLNARPESTRKRVARQWTKSDVEKELATDKIYLKTSSEDSKISDKTKEINAQQALVDNLQRDLDIEKEKLKKLSLELASLQSVKRTKQEIPNLLAGVMKNTQTANEIAKELGKEARFSARVFKDSTTGANRVEVNMKSKMGSFYWDLDKFNERFADMLNMHEDYCACKKSGEIYHFNPPEEMDPFNDNEYQLIGKATAWLKSIGNMMESSITSAILSTSGKKEGEMIIQINPCDANGYEGPWDEDDENDPFIESPELLLSKDIKFKIRIPGVKFIHKDSVPPYEITYIRYKLKGNDPNAIYCRTDKVISTSLEHHYHYNEEHTLHITEEWLEHIMNGKIVFEVWGQLQHQSARTAVKKAVQGVSAVNRLVAGLMKDRSPSFDSMSPSSGDKSPSLPPLSARMASLEDPCS